MTPRTPSSQLPAADWTAPDWPLLRGRIERDLTLRIADDPRLTFADLARELDEPGTVPVRGGATTLSQRSRERLVTLSVAAQGWLSLESRGVDDWLTDCWRGEEPLDGLIREEGFGAADEIRRRLEEFIEGEMSLTVDDLYLTQQDGEPMRLSFEREAFAAVGDHLWCEFGGYGLPRTLVAQLIDVTGDRAAELLSGETPAPREDVLMNVTMDAVDEFKRRDPWGDPVDWLMSPTAHGLLVADEIAAWSVDAFDELSKTLPPPR